MSSQCESCIVKQDDFEAYIKCANKNMCANCIVFRGKILEIAEKEKLKQN